ncbi:MAG: ABC transporter permease [Oscillospiraceae bacterium]|jgi:oligopeptide transport system permease protein|nr:ABC transporter permease [Oscillospiraceae bacterium]
MKDIELTPDLFEPVPASELDAEAIARPSMSYGQQAWRRFRRDRLAFGGAIVLCVIALAAIFGPMLSPYTYSQQDWTQGNLLPSMTHICGTDKFGRDIFTRILYGARISLSIGIVAALISTIIGILYGGIAGSVGGKTDMIMMRIVDILLSLPSLLYTILIMMFLGPTMQSILIAVCFTAWIGTARVVRSQVLSLKDREYVLAAKLCGANGRQILLRHLIPNAIGPTIVSTAFIVPSAIFSEAFLSFLGIGIAVPMASWGTLANEAIPMMREYPYQIVFPVIAISLTMFALNFIGDGMRDALDPHLRK